MHCERWAAKSHGQDGRIIVQKAGRHVRRNQRCAVSGLSVKWNVTIPHPVHIDSVPNPTPVSTYTNSPQHKDILASSIAALNPLAYATKDTLFCLLPHPSVHAPSPTPNPTQWILNPLFHRPSQTPHPSSPLLHRLPLQYLTPNHFPPFPSMAGHPSFSNSRRYSPCLLSFYIRYTCTASSIWSLPLFPAWFQR